MFFIGIDLGTSFIKGAVLNTHSLRPEQVVRVPFPEPLTGLPAGFCEYDPEPIVVAAQRILDRLAPLVPNCQGVLWSTQMHGFVLTDEQGNTGSDLVTWLDERAHSPHPAGGGSYFDVLAARLTPDEFRSTGGIELRPGVPAGALFWLAENGRLPRPGMMPVSVGDFVVARLCRTRPVTELTNAHAHGLLDMRTGDWHRGVIDKLGLGGLVFPEIRPQGSVVGHLRLAGREVPAFTPIGDYQCSLCGSQFSDGDLSLNISTGSQVSLLRHRLEFGQFQTRPFFDGKYAITVTTIPAGRALNSLVKLLSELAVGQGVALPDPWPYISAAAAKADDPELQAKLSFFACALGDRGELTNLRESELTVGHLFRAAFRNMADSYAICADRLASERPWQRLVFSGGLVQKIDLLRQMICERFAVPYRFCPVPEDAMLGLLTLGLAFTGRAGSVEQAIQIVAESS